MSIFFSYFPTGLSNKGALADNDNDFDPGLAKSKKATARTKARPSTEIGNASVHTHTLVEDHNHVLSASFDVSKISHVDNQIFSIDPASAQEDFGFGDFFPMSDDHYLVDVLGDELARELGWQSPTAGSEA